MLLKQFRNKFLDQILIFLWEQWGLLGIAGQSSKESQFVIDPEALLVFSLEMSRYEPRLFDEILGWLYKNSHWMDAARLRRILQQQSTSLKVMGAVLHSCTTQTSDRKWINLARFCSDEVKKNENANGVVSLFKEKSERNYGIGLKSKADPDFIHFGLDRSKIKKSKESKSVPVDPLSNIRFLLRSLFGVGGRAECLLYLLTHPGGRVRDIASGAGLFWLSARQILDDLIVSDIVSTRRKGKQTEYWLSHARWWSFLCPAQKKPDLKNPNWIFIYPALLKTWQTIENLNQTPPSEYMLMSKLRDCVEHLSKELSQSDLSIPSLPADKNIGASLLAIERLFLILS